MIHVLYKNNELNQSISVKPIENSAEIGIEYLSNKSYVSLTPKELSDFIGILLHVQSKIKRDNGRK